MPVSLQGHHYMSSGDIEFVCPISWIRCKPIRDNTDELPAENTALGATQQSRKFPLEEVVVTSVFRRIVETNVFKIYVTTYKA